MVKILQELSVLELILAGGGLAFSVLFTGWLTDMLLGKTGLGVLLNGLVVVAGVIGGLMTHSWMVVHRYL